MNTDTKPGAVEYWYIGRAEPTLRRLVEHWSTVDELIEMDGCEVSDLARVDEDGTLWMLCEYDASGGRCCDTGSYGGADLWPILGGHLPSYAHDEDALYGTYRLVDPRTVTAATYSFAGRYDYRPGPDYVPEGCQQVGVTWYRDDDDPCEPSHEHRALVWAPHDHPLMYRPNLHCAATRAAYALAAHG
ncbi:MAG: hypothetical protein KDB16_19350 [Acidimicrobiales bacterium]|nr:hypothetical protein [Acidimicrobiales bacterium]